MRTSETDPLLPKGATAPEISGYGFSTASKKTPHEIIEESDTMQIGEETVEGEEAESVYRGFAPFRILITLFSIVVGLAVFITLIIPGSWDILRPPSKTTGPTISARVDKILRETPLIGL